MKDIKILIGVLLILGFIIGSLLITDIALRIEAHPDSLKTLLAVGTMIVSTFFKESIPYLTKIKLSDYEKIYKKRKKAFTFKWNLFNKNSNTEKIKRK